MAIEKMDLAFCKGKVEQLDKLIFDCCVDGNFHVEDAGKFISQSMGFKSYNEENPYKPLMTHIQEIADLAGVKLTQDKVSEIGLINSQIEDKIKELDEKVNLFVSTKKDLQEQRQKCENATSVYSNFAGLDVDIDKINECEFIKARFGRLPKESYVKLSLEKEKQKSLANTLVPDKDIVVKERQPIQYFLEINPREIENLEKVVVKFGYFKRDDFKALKKYQKENAHTFDFIECSFDGERQWGVYITPRTYRTENDMLFAKNNFQNIGLFKEEENTKIIARELKSAMRYATREYGRPLRDKPGESSDSPDYMFLACGEDKTSVWGVYFSPVEKLKETDRTFASLHFELIEMPGAAGKPEEIVENLKKDIEIIDAEIDELNKKAIKFWDENAEECNRLYSMLYAHDKIFEMKKHAVVSEGYFFFVGWVVRKYKRAFNRAAQAIDNVEVQFSTPEENPAANPPTKLKNLKLARPFEFFVDMYGLPGYNDIDITGFVAITYTLMFGIMFGDVGQGLVLMIAGALMWKIKKMALGKALIPCGVSAMIFGFLYGSVFGYEEMLDPVYNAIGLGKKPISVLDSVNTILIFAISIGIALVAVSIGINIYACIKRKDFGQAIFSQNGAAGLLFYLCAVNLAVKMMSSKEIIPAGISKWVLIIGAAVLLFKEILIDLVNRKPDWKPESIGDYLMQNIFELLEYVLSYASNTVSFLRVGAFVLVHAGMMMVVFNLAGADKNLFVIILGNVLVIALEGLLTGIQAMRLEFYEMFSRFYEGDGRAFNAVRLKYNR